MRSSAGHPYARRFASDVPILGLSGLARIPLGRTVFTDASQSRHASSAPAASRARDGAHVMHGAPDRLMHSSTPLSGAASAPIDRAAL